MKISLFSVPLFRRLLLFVALFVVISGVSGSWLIGTGKLLFPYHYGIYGSLGKGLLFGVLVLGLFIRDQVTKIEVPRWRLSQTLLVGLGLGCLGPFFYSARQLLALSPVQPWHIFNLVAHLSLILAVALVFMACFPPRWLRSFIKQFKKELALAFSLTLAFWFFLDRVIALWPYLSRLVLSGVVSLLRLTHNQVAIAPPLTIQLPQFSITIAQYCSGIESLLLLTFLYLMIGSLDRQRLIIKRYVLLYGGLVIGMMAVNILRVYLIIQAGLWFSPQVAAKLFHTYLGMLLFLAYFLIVMVRVYPWTLSLPKGESL